jgi:hypothetical protein
MVTKEREVNIMTHTQFIKANFKVLAETENAIFFEAYGELCCEINGVAFDCESVEEFYELVEQFGDETFEE